MRFKSFTMLLPVASKSKKEAIRVKFINLFCVKRKIIVTLHRNSRRLDGKQREMAHSSIG